MAWTWDFMRLAFESLGGTMENVALKADGDRRVLVPVDPSKTAGVKVPQNLIFPLADVDLVNGTPRLKESAAAGKAERTFFESYYDSFPWSGADRDRATSFLKGLDALPDAVRTVLSEDFSIDLPHFESDEQTGRWLLQSRVIAWRGIPVLVPFLDFVSHDPDADPNDETSGILFVGTFRDEVRMLRARMSPFAAFWQFGYASPERLSFSLPMTLETESGFGITIAQTINQNVRLGGTRVPDFKCSGRTVSFSCLMLGSQRNPKLARSVFYRILRDAGETNPEQVFDKIAHTNRMIFLKLLAALEPFEEGLIPTLRTVVRYELEAMSSSIGTRDL